MKDTVTPKQELCYPPDDPCYLVSPGYELVGLDGKSLGCSGPRFFVPLNSDYPAIMEHMATFPAVKK